MSMKKKTNVQAYIANYAYHDLFLMFDRVDVLKSAFNEITSENIVFIRRRF